MNALAIKVGFCVAYDWILLRYSLPLVYDRANVICLSLDQNRVSWGGEKFEFDERPFRAFLREIDTQKKIIGLEESFYKPELSPMENEVRQRNIMAEFMGIEGWHIQLVFVQFLKTDAPRLSANICCAWITLFKKLPNGYLIIDPQKKTRVETIAVASTSPRYQYGRKNGYSNFYTKFKILHQSWARAEIDIVQKINNWGHKNDFDAKRFIDFWKSLDESNYKEALNFHPIDPPIWPSLRFVPSSSIEELIRITPPFYSFSTWDLRLKNSKVLSKIKQLWYLIK